MQTIRSLREQLDQLYEQRLEKQKSPDTPKQDLKELGKRIEALRAKITLLQKEAPLPCPPHPVWAVSRRPKRSFDRL